MGSSISWVKPSAICGQGCIGASTGVSCLTPPRFKPPPLPLFRTGGATSAPAGAPCPSKPGGGVASKQLARLGSFSPHGVQYLRFRVVGFNHTRHPFACAFGHSRASAWSAASSCQQLVDDPAAGGVRRGADTSRSMMAFPRRALRRTRTTPHSFPHHLRARRYGRFTLTHYTNVTQT